MVKKPKNKNKTKPEKSSEEEEQGDPVCERCGSTMISENGQWVCPVCQGKIDYFGGEDEKLD